MEPNDPSLLSVQAAELVLACDEVNATLAFFVERLGFEVLAVFPADEPRVGVLGGHGLRLRFEQAPGLTPGSLRLECAGLEQARELHAPNGTRVQLVPATRGYVLPSLETRFTLSQASQAEWGEGRAGMRYRDLIPGRLGGRFIASQIRIDQGGEVPDYVHFHRVRFQLIYCARGWVRVVYEDQGEPFVLEAGDCVLQPPEIRHRVLESSPGLEVIELSCPAEHETRADPALFLPNGRSLPQREFDGQRFQRHRASEASWQGSGTPGFEARDLGMGEATRGLAGAQVLRAAQPAEAALRSHSAELHFVFVLQGALGLEREGQPRLELSSGDACTLPAGLMHRFVQPSEDCELLQVTLPGELDLREAP